ncbi:uncharacterized protein SEPMUDRAFT_147907 [Sphaerulina musiva SO2202]|uniref:Uncharacterized protein n=1 Tax=Sphaerulina musiva (strain SO2202) TaxID=692275 RepID=M3D7C3_SPHMS|nr:uncharacterized protein SEPMUDRAFT_147907 [Sphaerulina musiva SO2202]EMF14070.1 hypothetical protein SEPMUDRAFT_147907 [Sphaerulina musiva SO2202]
MLFDENFTFEPPRSPSSGSDTTTTTTSSFTTRDTSRAVSPCTSSSSAGSAASPVPRFSVTDLAVDFASSRLRHEAQICYDSCEAYANMDDDDASWEIPGSDDSNDSSSMTETLSRPRTLPPPPVLQRSYSPSRRMARQLNTRLLCSTSHAKDIAALVGQMVERKEHCNVVMMRSDSRMQRCDTNMNMSNNNEDEGYDSGTGGSTTTRLSSRRSSSIFAVQQQQQQRPRLVDYRRMSDLKLAAGGGCGGGGGGARVCKTIRQKKSIKCIRVRSGGETVQ